MIDPKANPLPNITLDWMAYYQEFSQRHGGDPVEFEGRLLFRDGWMHSKSSYEGPEWAPPLPVTVEGELRLRYLVRSYWEVRRRMVNSQLEDLTQMVAELERIQFGRDGVLQQRVVEPWTDDKGQRRLRVGSTEVDLLLLRERLRWLSSELVECDGKLAECQGAQNAQDHQEDCTSTSLVD